MAASRRMEAPGNFRADVATRGSRGGVLDQSDVAREDLPRAAVVYIRRGGKILTVSRGENVSDVNMPGGGVEPGEAPVDAAARELWEETGLRATRLVPIYEAESRGRLVSVFAALEYGGEIRHSPEGRVSWETPERLMDSAYGDFFRRMMGSVNPQIVGESKKILPL